eukprot:GHVQ01000948.1.p1 GENE.GHVQ01000948.1~~GHVQ01000948.1.p1  ORF type:complete len:153 (-),score=7.25 GHVQ01000948.1:63-521(-)
MKYMTNLYELLATRCPTYSRDCPWYARNASLLHKYAFSNARDVLLLCGSHGTASVVEQLLAYSSCTNVKHMVPSSQQQLVLPELCSTLYGKCVAVHQLQPYLFIFVRFPPYIYVHTQDYSTARPTYICVYTHGYCAACPENATTNRLPYVPS